MEEEMNDNMLDTIYYSYGYFWSGTWEERCCFLCSTVKGKQKQANIAPHITHSHSYIQAHTHSTLQLKKI